MSTDTLLIGETKSNQPQSNQMFVSGERGKPEYPEKHLLSSLHTANLSWETLVGKPKLVCVNGTKTGGKHVCKLLASNRNVFANCFYAVHTHQLEFANTSLPTLVCRVKATLENQQTQPTYDAGSGNRARGTLVKGERSRHCAISALHSV